MNTLFSSLARFFHWLLRLVGLDLASRVDSLIADNQRLSGNSLEDSSYSEALRAQNSGLREQNAELQNQLRHADESTRYHMAIARNVARMVQKAPAVFAELFGTITQTTYGNDGKIYYRTEKGLNIEFMPSNLALLVFDEKDLVRPIQINLGLDGVISSEDRLTIKKFLKSVRKYRVLGVRDDYVPPAISLLTGGVVVVAGELDKRVSPNDIPVLISGPPTVAEDGPVDR